MVNAYKYPDIAPMTRTAFLIPILDKWLLHAPLHQITALINHSAARLLKARNGQNLPGELGELCDLICSQPDYLPGPNEGEIIPAFLGIIPTRSCNMSCIYCNFGGPSAEIGFMQPEIAIAAVDWAAGQLGKVGQKRFHIQFFGGEPFVAQELVEIIVHRARYVSTQKGLTPYFDASTNGLFNERQCQFMGDYFDGVVLSLDGPPELQDKYRPVSKGRPSSAIVERTARRLGEMPLELCLRMCITQESVNRMEEITHWMIEKFSPSIIDFETITPGELARRAGLAPPDPYQFAIHAERACRLAAAAGIKALYSAAEASAPRLSLCPVGNDVIIVSPDGRLSACYLLPEEWEKRGLNLDLGRFDPDRGIVIFSDRLEKVRRLPTNKLRCEKCFCQFTCAGGCHVNQACLGSNSEYTGFCIQTRIMTACRLLREVGFQQLSEALLENREALERLALQPCDYLEIGGDSEATIGRSQLPAGSSEKAFPLFGPLLETEHQSDNHLLEVSTMHLSKTNGKKSKTTYRIAPELKWTVEMQGLLLVDGQGKNHWLSYPKAALWDLISRSQPAGKVCSIMAYVAALNPRATEELILESLEEWTGLGLLLQA
jgi:uncharacterized protein